MLFRSPVKVVQTKGGDFPVFRKGGEAAQSFQSALKGGSDTWKAPGETGPERKYANPEWESGGKAKKIKEAISELSVPAGTTGKRKEVSAPSVAIRMASGKIEKHPAGKSGSSGGGDE